jgi:hypothetical protein
MTPTTTDIIRAAEHYGPTIRMPLEQVAVLDAQYGRARVLDHALASRDEAFRLAAASSPSSA